MPITTTIISAAASNREVHCVLIPRGGVDPNVIDDAIWGCCDTIAPRRAISGGRMAGRRAAPAGGHHD